MEESHLTCEDLIQLMVELNISDDDISLLAGVLESKKLGMVRDNLCELLTFVPVFSQLGLEVLEALHSTAKAITDPEERRGLGLYLTNELRTRGAGYVAWKILNSQHRQSWVPEEAP